MNKITVFTPTFNRANTLRDAYKSLLEQTCIDFTWLIIDDGSNDGTKEMVHGWRKERKITISYHWKPNGGMHTAHNLALDLIHTELCFCLDSDDQLKPNAVQSILNFWESNPNRTALAGIVMHENYRNSGKIIGSAFPAGILELTFRDMYYRYMVNGDKLLIYRTELLKNNPYPVFENEVFVALDCKYLLIDRPLAVLNDSVYKKEYLSDGHSKNVMKAYARNPLGFAFYHNLRMKLIDNVYINLKSSVHLTACVFLSGQKDFLKRSPRKILTLLTFPAALIWYCRLKREKKALGL
jgi:glycosyltransferase involved in cell wall biosynthesis